MLDYCTLPAERIDQRALIWSSHLPLPASGRLCSAVHDAAAACRGITSAPCTTIGAIESTLTGFQRPTACYAL